MMIRPDIRADFPLLQNHRDLIFFDSAASAQKPKLVINAMNDMMQKHYANIHRGQYQLSANATERYEQARTRMANFIGASAAEEIIFTRNATESLNLLSYSLSETILQAGDCIVSSPLEHHSNFVPWQRAAKRHHAQFKLCPLNSDQLSLNLNALENIFQQNRVKIVTLTHISNICGAILPIAEIAKLAHRYGALLVVDGAQAAPHIPLNMQDLEADFYIFTGHKLYGPSAIGVLYGKSEHLNAMPPFLSGGGMVTHVDDLSSSYALPPTRFEAGTPPIIEAIGLHAALDYITQISFDAILAHENQLNQTLFTLIENRPFIQLVGNNRTRASVFGFNLQDKNGNVAQANDVATLLDEQQIAVRAGHHCAQPFLRYLGINACVRASFGLYNTIAELETFAKALDKTAKILKLLD